MKTNSLSASKAKPEPDAVNAKHTKVVVIGGGSGRFTLLEGLRRFPLDISAIVSMTDSGGSSGRLRAELGVLPPGDVRQCLVALSTSPKVMLDLFNYRFSEGSLAGHSFGNLFLTALEKTTGSFDKAVEECERILAIEGRVIPVTLGKSELVAQLEDGTEIEGETNIDIPKAKRARIKKVFLRPQVSASQKAIEAIADADLIVIGPGDLYTSIIPNLLVEGISKAICASDAVKVFVLPLATKRGETDGFSPQKFVKEIEYYCGCSTQFVISNSRKFPRELLATYGKEGAEPVICNSEEIFGSKVVCADLLSQAEGLARHDPIRTAQAVLSCLGNEYKHTVKK